VPRIANDLRDSLLTGFRQAVCQKMSFVPFVHQAEWWAAADGQIITDRLAWDGDGVQVQLGDGSTEYRQTIPRPAGRAHVVADLGSFKIGKSRSSAIWASGFAAVPHARVKLVGLEYDTCAPEFEYLVEAICSERGMNIAPSSLQNRPRDGRMWLDLPNGARFEARSWERKDGLKGKEDDCYVFCEAYQLPGLEAYTDFKQNLTARNGYAVFPTTPDRPWVKVFHEHGHGDPDFPEWQCICGVPRNVNPYTFSQTAKDQDRKVMTREKFAIHYEGQLGEFVGSVFNYQRGQRVFTPRSHPELWRADLPAGVTPTIADLRVPPHWEVLGSADTGTFTSALLAAFSPTGEAFILHEAPNYRYVAGRHEFDDESSIPRWATSLRLLMTHFGVRGLWADRNSQFKQELQHYDVILLGATAGLEQRTEVTREYFQQKKVFLAPWLSVLPYELEQAQWPAEATLAGKFSRLKQQDHTLDCLEHLLARRPHATVIEKPDTRLWIEQYLNQKMTRHRGGNPHLGVQ
jgi:hypothetical protein